MRLQIGQRWLWHFSLQNLHNDIVLEISSIISNRVTFKYIQIIDSNDKYDVVGRIRETGDFSNLLVDDVYDSGLGHIYTYLRGQDKPAC